MKVQVKDASRSKPFERMETISCDLHSGWSSFDHNDKTSESHRDVVLERCRFWLSYPQWVDAHVYLCGAFITCSRFWLSVILLQDLIHAFKR